MGFDKQLVRPGDLQVWPDHVIIFGQRVDRPSYLSRSDWLATLDNGKTSTATDSWRLSLLSCTVSAAKLVP